MDLEPWTGKQGIMESWRAIALFMGPRSSHHGPGAVSGPAAGPEAVAALAENPAPDPDQLQSCPNQLVHVCLDQMYIHPSLGLHDWPARDEGAAAAHQHHRSRAWASCCGWSSVQHSRRRPMPCTWQDEVQRASKHNPLCAGISRQWGTSCC